MDQIIKIPSNQGSFDTSGNKNLVDITLPAGLGVVNLEKSFVNVNFEVNQKYDNDGEAVLPGLVTVNTKAALTGVGDSSCLVRNCSAISANKGKIEDVRRADCIRYNLSLYEKGEADRKDNINKVNGVNPEALFKDFNYGALVKEGNFKSTQKAHDVRIPLKSVFGFCKTENYDTDAHGATRFHFEMNFDKCATSEFYANDAKYNLGYDLGAAPTAYEKMDDQGAVPATGIATVTTVNEYADLQYSPWFVGQLVKVTSTIAAGAPATIQNARITQVAKADDSDKLILSFNKVVSAAAAGAYSAIKVEPQGDPETKELTINNVEAVFHINGEPDMEEAKSPMVYSVMHAQEDSYPAANSANLNYLIPENCKNVYVVFNSTILSQNAELKDYRLTIDNKEIVNRAVDVESPLHYELVSQTFANNNKVVGSIKEVIQGLNNSKSQASTGRAQGGNEKYIVIMAPIPFKPVPQRLGVELNAEAGEVLTGSHIVFSECIKKL